METLSEPVLGILETTGWTPAIVALDEMEKHAQIQLVQTELNDFLGVVIKITGQLSSVTTAIRAGHVIADKLQGKPVSTVLKRVSPNSQAALLSEVEFNPLIQQNVVRLPSYQSPALTAASYPDPSDDGTPQNNPQDTDPTERDETMNNKEANQALGFIETQGFTAVFQAIDTACKAAQVEVIGKEKLGGGYVTVVIEGDVAAVKAAIESGRQEVEQLGKLIAAHVIPRPSDSVRALLPK